MASGANNNQAAPSILAVASVPGLTTIDYTVTGTVGQAYTIDFYASNSLGGPAAPVPGDRDHAGADVDDAELHGDASTSPRRWRAVSR